MVVTPRGELSRAAATSSLPGDERAVLGIFLIARGIGKA
jgi:hypothetical protein